MVSLFSLRLTLLLPKDVLWILVAWESECVWLRRCVATKITTDTDDFICRTCGS
jgi:hypothetical protein